jgi:hypothetical protein
MGSAIFEWELVVSCILLCLRPEDYEPMQDDGLGFGDYPKLAKVSSDMKSDWEEWDDTYNKRNYGEPVSTGRAQLPTIRHCSCF